MSQNLFYPHVVPSPDFPRQEEEILAFWAKERVFQHSIDTRPLKTNTGANNEYIFYDGPPFANGLPHYGHILTGFAKDTVARYQTMQGKRVERRFGWDCHGLPAEMEAEKDLGISGRKQIMDYGVDRFNAHCRKTVMKYAGEWEKYVTRQARWVDFAHDYKTMDRDFMESVLWAFKQLHSKGLVYEAMRVLPYSWACETPLSNFETRLDNAYREKADKAVTVTCTLTTAPEGAPQGCLAYKLLVWTTTPWTLPSNLALAVNPDLSYSCVVRDDICYILGAGSVQTYAKKLKKEGEEYFTTIPGRHLLGLSYTPLFPYFADHPRAFTILAGSFVVEGEGTGIVHMAPGFGEEDQQCCEAAGIALLCPVDERGAFTAEITDFAGMHVFDAIDPIIMRLKEESNWFQTDQYVHNYPHCWRTDTPLIYKAVSSWYVKVTDFKDRMVAHNQSITWMPEHIRDGLFGKWLENARDWSISRNRFWGTPIPIWKSDNPAFPRLDVYGSIAELEADFGVTITDLHKDTLDPLVRPNPDDPSGASMMRRIPDVFDCWFESGSMPYAQVHYPFENKEWFESHCPADFIVEYVAQTRGWFYTLMVLSTALFDRPPFLNCICHGVILDEKGQKLSKRLQNYANPLDIFDELGADATRWLMLSSTVMRGNELLIDKEGRMIRDVIRLALKPIWNSYHFFTLYANADGARAEYSTDSPAPLDHYIFSKVKEAILAIKMGFDAYDLPAAYQAAEGFFEVLNNWYIRRSRHRFWKHEQDSDKQQAYNTLYTVLHMMMRAMAPMAPLLTETIFAGLTNGGIYAKETSVHIASFPDVSGITSHPALIEEMDCVRDICTAIHAIRHSENIRVRQPLRGVTIVGTHLPDIRDYHGMIEEETNVKEIALETNIEAFATFQLKLDFKLLGKRYPHKVKDCIAAAKDGRWEIADEGHLRIAGEEVPASDFELALVPKEAKATLALPRHRALIVLDTELTPELIDEGIMRDMVRLVQQARKAANFDIADRIYVAMTLSPRMQSIIDTHREYIEAQTLSSFTPDSAPAQAHHETQDIEGESIHLTLWKAALP